VLSAYAFSTNGNGLEADVVDLPLPHTITFHARDIRKERTGLHALVGISIDKKALLKYDTFNVGRNEERRRLARSAHSVLHSDLKLLYDMDGLCHDLDNFCLGLEIAWRGRFTVEHMAGEQQQNPLSYVLRPYIVEGAGTILFGPPGKGKSYIALLMAQCINYQIESIWNPVGEGPVLYVNLERSATSIQRRISHINRAIGLPPEYGLDVLNARGEGLIETEYTIRHAMRQKKYSCVFLDSISRVGGSGSLTEDTTANRIVNTLSSLSSTWLAIGHSNRAGDKHTFGSIHFDAGMDIGLSIDSEDQDDGLVVGMRVTKSNDTPFPPPAALKLVFDEDGLSNIVTADSRHYPQLLAPTKISWLDLITEFLANAGKSSTGEIAEGTGLDPGNVSRSLKHPRFIRLGREGKHVYYGLADEA